MDNLIGSLYFLITQFKANFEFLSQCILFFIAIHLCTLFTQKRLLLLGIQPRHAYGLPGIFFAPVLHADFNHLFFNLIPFVVLASFVLIQGQAYFIKISLFIVLLSGFLIWLFAKPGIHIGASALITGYWGLLITGAVYEKTLIANFLAVICLYYFAGIFFGLFPQSSKVSWEGHVFGLLAGIGAYGFFNSIVV